MQKRRLLGCSFVSALSLLLLLVLVVIAPAVVPVGGGAVSNFAGPGAGDVPRTCAAPNLFIPAGSAAPTWWITGCAFW